MIGRLTQTFARLAAKKEAALMPFLVVGDPDTATSLDLALALHEGGADILEFGFPFSDPPADGPVIQAADVRALSAGMTTAKAFEYLSAVRARIGQDVPIVLLIYYNLILQQGVDAFFARAAQCGVDGILIADMPVEEARSAGVLAAASKHDIAPVFIVSELTTEARLADVLEVGRGYLYLVAHLGVTGARKEIGPQLASTISRLKARSSLPILAGFGISDGAQARQIAAAGCDGVIVGSALIERVARHLGDPRAMKAAVLEFVRELKAATRP